MTSLESFAHEKAISLFEKHRELFEQYAGYSITIKPAPTGLDTFAFDLKSNTIYLNDKFYSLLGYPEAGTSFATFHEIEHFREKLALLDEENGTAIFDAYLNKLDTRISPQAGAYGVMDNCISDVRQNGAVVLRTHEGFDEVEKKLYTDVQFPDVDFTAQPLHVQLPYAILNEYRSGRQCVVDPRVREIITELQHTKLKNGKEIDLIALMTNPDPKVVSMSKRLLIQDKHIWPRVQELLEEDLKQQQEERKDSGESQDSQNGEQGSDGEKSEGQSGEQGTSDEKGTGKQENAEGAPNPNEIFKDVYADAAKRVPNAMPVEAQKEALKEWAKENGSPSQQAERKIAEKLGVRPEDLRAYKRIAEAFNTPNLETNESTIDELEELIKSIISRRPKEVHKPKRPVDDGEELEEPAIWMAEVMAGNLQPNAWERTEIKLEKDKKFGEIEITLICDRSGSMRGEKQREQQKALVLFMEALKRFNDMLDDEEASVEKQLSIKSEIYTFQADGTDATPVKKMGKVLTERERITSAAKVATTPGDSTTDFIPLEAIQRSLDSETLEKIKEGELRKVVIVFTDGASDDSSRVGRVCDDLRKKGVMVVGVGITESGKSALTTYAPKAVLAGRAEELPLRLREILKEILTDV